jgi:transglutaminase-like putative cysteine protease
MLSQVDAMGWAQGDCDDIATLAGALTLAQGHPSRYIIVDLDGTGYSHVWAEALDVTGWVELDTSRDLQGVDVRRMRPVRRVVYPL